MFHLKDNFRPNAPISQVPASWFNAVASFLNNLVGGYGVNINKNGAIPVVSIKPEVLAEHSKDKPTTEHTELETPSENQDFASKGHVYDEANDAWSLHDTTWVRGGKKGLKMLQKIFLKKIKKISKKVLTSRKLCGIIYHVAARERHDKRLREHSSAGRAPALQAGGHRFEPYCSHHTLAR